MCTATTMLLALVPAGGHIVTTTDCYRRTRQFIQTMLPKMGITVCAPGFSVCRFRRPGLLPVDSGSASGGAFSVLQTTVIDPSDLVALGKALDDHKVSLFFSESPTNPYLRCVDVKKISEVRVLLLVAVRSPPPPTT
jgi:cystathionine gamma-synthase